MAVSTSLAQRNGMEIRISKLLYRHAWRGQLAGNAMASLQIAYAVEVAGPVECYLDGHAVLDARKALPQVPLHHRDAPDAKVVRHIADPALPIALKKGSSRAVSETDCSVAGMR